MLRTLLLALLIAFSLTACGNKGPLVLPDKTPAPQSKDKDKSDSTTQPAASQGTDAANQH